jgi:preprotein translocase subunit SecG
MRASNFDKTHGKMKSVERAPQVSDIIWENVPSTGTLEHDWLKPALLTVVYVVLACVVFYVVLLLTTTKLDIGRTSAERVRSVFTTSEDRCVAHELTQAFAGCWARFWDRQRSCRRCSGRSKSVVVFLVTRAFAQWVPISGSWSSAFAADGATSDQEGSLDGTRSNKLDEKMQNTITIKAAIFITILITLLNIMIKPLILRATRKVAVPRY